VTECRLFNKNVSFSVHGWLKSREIFESIRKTLFVIYHTGNFLQITLRKRRKFKVHSHLFFTLYEHLLVILLGVYKHLCGLEVLIRRPGVNIPSRCSKHLLEFIKEDKGNIQRQGARSEQKIKVKRIRRKNLNHPC
jgi:hypothetical protein